MDQIVPIIVCVGGWAFILGFRFRKSLGEWLAKYQAAEAERRADLAGGRRAQCEHGADEPHLCGLPGVHRGARSIGVEWTEGPCRHCDKGRPRWIGAKEIAKFEQDIRDGWLKPDGNVCERELYAEAFKRKTTPAVIAAERGQRSSLS